MPPKPFQTYPQLRPLSRLYACIMQIRNKRFDTGKTRTESFPVPVICVGNISVGGTGKTPMCAYILDRLYKDGKFPALLSRGYGRKTRGFNKATPQATAAEIGDEPMEIYNRFDRRIPVFVCEKRCDGARLLLKDSPQTDIIVLDDAYQHRYIHRDLNILLTDYNRLYTRDKVMPEGRLRELPEGADRADVIVVTKCPASLDAEEARKIREEINPKPNQELFFGTIGYEDCIGETTTPNDRLKILIFTGIAKADPLIERYTKTCPQVKTIKFADHHAFTPSDIERIAKASAKADVVITTAKDYQRLPASLPNEIKGKLRVQNISMQFLFGQATEFDKIILSIKTKHTTSI